MLVNVILTNVMLCLSPFLDIHALFLSIYGVNDILFKMFSWCKFQVSTESNASCSSAPDHIPRKQEIQNDIRHNKGRFELVQKNGRSCVWKLFGQVIEKRSRTRLPYVACYACKVLYTDSGGGTGNMTRHRCTMGNSYRSKHATRYVDIMFVL